jgi:hypothetical protein
MDEPAKATSLTRELGFPKLTQFLRDNGEMTAEPKFNGDDFGNTGDRGFAATAAHRFHRPLPMHWPHLETPLADTARTIDQGKIRAIGVSNFSPAQMRMFSTTPSSTPGSRHATSLSVQSRRMSRHTLSALDRRS